MCFADSAAEFGRVELGCAAAEHHHHHSQQHQCHHQGLLPGPVWPLVSWCAQQSSCACHPELHQECTWLCNKSQHSKAQGCNCTDCTKCTDCPNRVFKQHNFTASRLLHAIITPELLGELDLLPWLHTLLNKCMHQLAVLQVFWSVLCACL